MDQLAAQVRAGVPTGDHHGQARPQLPSVGRSITMAPPPGSQSTASTYSPTPTSTTTDSRLHGSTSQSAVSSEIGPSASQVGYNPYTQGRHSTFPHPMHLAGPTTFTSFPGPLAPSSSAIAATKRLPGGGYQQTTARGVEKVAKPPKVVKLSKGGGQTSVSSRSVHFSPI